MLAMVKSCGLNGMQVYPITVEVDVGIGLSAFEIVGLPDASVRESKERVRSALNNSGFAFPLQRITVNLAPAAIRKEGPSLDLPIALGILLATGQINDGELIRSSAFVGTLSLEGSVYPISGALALADELAQSKACRYLFLPADNAAEAGIIRGLDSVGVSDLRQLVALLNGERSIVPTKTDVAAIFAEQAAEKGPDMSEVRGQKAVKRALEIAAAGGHNVLIIGPPGSGKTMLAHRLPTILPPLNYEESLEVTKIYSIGGKLPAHKPLLTRRPFCAPHHSASSVSIIGGGSHPKPGEISYACHGVLFMDELPEFPRIVLEALRQPLEDRVVTVTRAGGRAEFPASFQFVASANPCPCGYFGDSLKPCTCTPYQRARYLSRISGPLLDRIDLHIEAPRVSYDELSGGAEEESSAVIRERVSRAREIQHRRFVGSSTQVNAAMTRRELVQFCKPEPEAEQLLQLAFARLQMSGRAHDRILKVARTIADLDGSDNIAAAHIAEAVQYRSLDREQQI